MNLLLTFYRTQKILITYMNLYTCSLMEPDKKHLKQYRNLTILIIVLYKSFESFIYTYILYLFLSIGPVDMSKWIGIQYISGLTPLFQTP